MHRPASNELNRRARTRLQRGQSMVEYSVLNYWIIVALCLALSSRVFGNNQNLIELFLNAYQVYYDSYYFILNLPFP